MLSESHYASSMGVDYRPDPARLAAGGLTGIGFLGAGVIVHSRFSVFGLTTAAGLWTVAVLGLTLGSRDYSLAFTLYGTMLGSLWLLRYFEPLLPRETFRQISLGMHGTNFTLAEAQHFFHQYRLVLERANIDADKQHQTVQYTFFVHGKKAEAFVNAFEALLTREDVYQGQLLQLDVEADRT
jgi:putative Mg2+ transporter-C (MgtC) family protein